MQKGSVYKKTFWLKFEISKITYEEAGCDKPNLPGYTWVTEFPLFELNEETGMIESTHHPFTSPHPDDEHILWEAINNKDPKRARQAIRKDEIIYYHL